jgi:hypothetical protein
MASRPAQDDRASIEKSEELKNEHERVYVATTLEENKLIGNSWNGVEFDREDEKWAYRKVDMVRTLGELRRKASH